MTSDETVGSRTIKGPPGSPLVIGVAGGTGSGKTTLAKAIEEALPGGVVAIVTHDAYYKERLDMNEEELSRVNYDHPDSLDNDLLVEHIDTLISGQSIEMPLYDFVTHRRKEETIGIEPVPVIIVEGILIFSSKPLLDRMDIKLFIDTPADIRVLRRVRRDMEHRGRTFEDIRRQYYETVRPMHEQFVEPGRRIADLVIPEGGSHKVAIDMIVGRVWDDLARRGWVR